MTPPALLCALLLLLALDAAPALAQSRIPPAGAATRPQPSARPREAEPDKLERLAAEVVRTTREYRASLERMLAMYQRDAEGLAELVEVRRDLAERQIVSKRDLEIAERLHAEAVAKVQETERWIVDADKIIGEAAVHTELSKMAPVPAGGYVSTAVFIRYNGITPFRPSELPRVERFFSARFGRPLPVSALGQSAAHDRIGFDHRNAVDVALHPDSPEGQALMGYLQAQSIPFVAVRQAVPGSSTGAHIHIGQPSRRLTAGR